MVITPRACLFTLCAMLSLPPLGGTLADPAVKPALTGLVSTGSAENTLDQLNQRMGIFGGLVVQVTWNQLQATDPNSIDTHVIDQALALVTTYNASAALLAPPNNRQIGVRLRVFSGCDAPDWAKSLGGSPISTSHVTNNGLKDCTLGRFWVDDPPAPGLTYPQAWAQLQTRLAAIYDSNPLIQEVAVTSCTTYTAEPFFLPFLPNDPANGNDVKRPLVDAGYSDTSYQRCLQQAVADYAPWKTTRLEFTFNPFDGLTTPAGDVAFSERVMRGCRQTAGQRCILSNHDLDAQPPSPGTILPLYALMRKLGPNITFQTYVVAPDDYEGTLRKGISLGAGSIEVWQEPKGFEAQSNATLKNWAAMFEPH